MILAAASGDNNYVYYAIVQKGEGPDKTKGITMRLLKANIKDGSIVKDILVSTAKDDLNIWNFDSCQMTLQG